MMPYNQPLAKVKTLSPTIAFPNQKALDLLSFAERPIIEAALRPKIKDLQPVRVVNELITILTSIYTIAGQKSDSGTLALYADEFYQKMLSTYPSITIEEVRIALKKGVYDEFEEYYGLNVRTFVSFIRSYLNSEERRIAKQNFETKLLLEPPQILTPEQRERSKKEFVNQLYTDFLNGTLVIDYIPSYLCGFLEEKRLIVLTNKEKLAIKERQLTIYEFFERCSKQGAKEIFD